MKRRKKIQPYESVQREIARRLQAGLPLAGILAATTLLCGCNESGFGRTAGDVPMDRNQQQAPPKNNDKNEDPEKIPMGDVPCESNRQQELENTRTTGIAPHSAPNRKREKSNRGAVRGKFTSSDEEK